MITAAFAAVEALARALAVELDPAARDHDPTRLPRQRDWSSSRKAERDALRQRVAAAMPVKPTGMPEDVAHAAVFFDDNPQATGIVLEVTGGETLVDGVA